MQKITPFLWFDHQAEAAMNFYVSVFKNARIVSMSRYGDAGPGPKGSVMMGVFQIEGQDFYALNGGPHYKFSPATSFFVNCETQAEVDHFWQKLSEGGKTNRCGWLDDQFGVTWQIVPTILGKLLQDKDRKKSANVMKAMMQMTKLEIDTLQLAYDEA